MAVVVDAAVTRREVESLLCDLPGGCPGEPQFQQPWELRIFAVVAAAYRAGMFPWSDFQDALIRAIAVGESMSLYGPWVEAMEAITDDRLPEMDPALPAVVVPFRRRTKDRGPVAVATATASTMPGGGITSWGRGDWRRAGVLLGAIMLLHLVAFGGLALVGGHYRVGTATFGVGLGITAYVFGVRHAFDVDHIAAIDNTTRKLRADGKRPKSVGLWFALGHSATVLVLAILVGVGARSAQALLEDQSDMHWALGVVSTLSSGGFLYLIGLLNLASLRGVFRVFRRMRSGVYDEAEFEAYLHGRGLFSRIIGRATGAITRPRQMFAVGLLFGLGFDTATEVALLALAGAGAATGVPWYVIVELPLLFAAGMCLFDTLDGIVMSLAYDWAFLNPLRKVYYNLAVTGLSVAVALVIGSIELATVLHDDLGWDMPVVSTLSAIPLDHLGFIVVGLFVAAWLVAIAYWRLARVQDRWGQRSE